MALLVNGFHISVGDIITRVVAKDVADDGKETVVGELAMLTPDALALAHKIIELHNSHSEKVIAGQQAQNGSGDPIQGVPTELVN